tara:strand:+ start:234 stop:830 length:597 start_codon:yes stop_codon:yes gene_type:complete
MYVNDTNDYIIVSGSFESENKPSGSTSQIIGGVSYVFGGNFTTEIQILSGSYSDDDDSYMDEDIGGYGLGMTYDIKDSSNPVNFSFGVAYAALEVNADYLDDAQITAKSTGTGLGLKLYKNIIKRQKLELTPYVALTSVNTLLKLEDSYGNSFEDDDQSSIISFGLGMKFDNFFIRPNISINDGESDFDITFGIILPQ